MGRARTQLMTKTSPNKSKKKEAPWGGRESNSQPFDLESNALPLRHHPYRLVREQAICC